MSFFAPETKVKRNFSLLGSFSWYTPGVGGAIGLVCMLLAGMLVASVVVFAVVMAFPVTVYGEAVTYYSNLISYPLMFVPAIIYALLVSRRNAFFDEGYALDSNHFGKFGGAALAVVAALSTLGLAVIGDSFTSLLPEMPAFLEDAMKTLVGGPLWLSILLPCVFAPLFEEWFCRGIILRGLLQKVSPAVAICISALIFAFIHLNPWQAVPAFLLGLLFGYVYYRTGSMKLTMLMHFTNNFMSVVLTRFASLGEAESLKDVLPSMTMVKLLVCSVVVVSIAVYIFSRVPLAYEKSNCDPVKAE
ncbi:MAG: CPBP family intramembrane metalloprotease [Bacteroidales bacterium]|nr:CPBP family intramembrane metalloprotease [Bacteroidales bacterium]